MSLDIANSNVNRNITLAGTSVAIFTFLLFFLYPRSGEINSILFQFTLAIIVSVIFSLVASATYYYGTVLTLSHPAEEASTIFGMADAFWTIGYSLLLLEPSLILFSVNLSIVGTYALILWLGYLYLTWLQFKKVIRRK